MASPVEVQDNSRRKVRAKMLVDAAGGNVRDPMTGAPLIVDEDFDINHAIAFGRALAPMMQDPDASGAALATMYNAFRDGGPLDMQRSYNGMVGGGGPEFVGAFRPAASYLLGVVGRAAGLNPEDILGGGGRYNRYRKSGPLKPNPNLNTSGPSGNAPTNARWIEEGIRAYDSGRFSKPSSVNPGGTDPQNQKAPAEDSILDGQPPPRQEQPSMPNFADLIPQPAGPQKTAGQSPAYQQVAVPSSSDLPQHVIDTGNYLRANGFEITPRTMYVSHVLGPQAAVDLFSRTGSTSSDAVPSPDATTGDQMRAWARALRLGPAATAGAINGMVPAPGAEPAMAGPPNDYAFAP